MTLTEKIQTAFIGGKYQGVEAMKTELAELLGQPMYCYDQWIDDGADDDETEDQYIKGVGFISEDLDITVRVYYGDVTEEIGYVDVEEPGIE